MENYEDMLKDLIKTYEDKITSKQRGMITEMIFDICRECKDTNCFDCKLHILNKKLSSQREN